MALRWLERLETKRQRATRRVDVKTGVKGLEGDWARIELWVDRLEKGLRSP